MGEQEDLSKRGFEELESVVGQLERGDLPLKDALALFERGVRLVAACSTRLDEAESRIQRLVQSAEGGFGLEPVEGGAE